MLQVTKRRQTSSWNQTWKQKQKVHSVLEQTFCLVFFWGTKRFSKNYGPPSVRCFKLQVKKLFVSAPDRDLITAENKTHASTWFSINFDFWSNIKKLMRVAESRFWPKMKTFLSFLTRKSWVWPLLCKWATSDSSKPQANQIMDGDPELQQHTQKTLTEFSLLNSQKKFLSLIAETSQQQQATLHTRSAGVAFFHKTANCEKL